MRPVPSTKRPATKPPARLPLHDSSAFIEVQEVGEGLDYAHGAMRSDEENVSVDGDLGISNCKDSPL